VAIIHTTILPETGMPSPLGKVNIAPTPTVAAQEIRRLNALGAVGAVVVQATQQVVCAVGAFPSPSSTNVTGLVGPTPLAEGLPIPYTPATPVF